jgi:SAM-dependent methyltransferase
MTSAAMRAEKTREQQRQTWGAAAPGWARRREGQRAATQPVTEALIELAAIGAGQRVLDLACGVGDPAFAIAALVGADGYVLGLDLTREMVAGAQARVAQQGVTQVEFRQIASELDLGIPPESFDAATCRFGLMFMPDPAAALRALHQALKPGGRVAVSTWAAPERCPFFVLPQQIVARHVELPAPDPTAPGPFALPTPAALEGLLHGAGYGQVQCVSREVCPVAGATPDEFWDAVSELSGSLASTLAALPQETRQAIRADAVATLGAMFPDGPVHLTAEALITAGTKAA